MNENGGGDASEGDLPAEVELPIEDHLDLHAFLPREIRDLVASYLEAAAEAGFAEVRLIHGRGIGTQREIVRSVLSRHPGVAGFADAPPERGGWGATVVRLRRRAD
jgi:DNA-nicking Smr family endonuclease